MDIDITLELYDTNTDVVSLICCALLSHLVGGSLWPATRYFRSRRPDFGMQARTEVCDDHTKEGCNQCTTMTPDSPLSRYCCPRRVLAVLATLLCVFSLLVGQRSRRRPAAFLLSSSSPEGRRREKTQTEGGRQARACSTYPDTPLLHHRHRRADAHPCRVLSRSSPQRLQRSAARLRRCDGTDGTDLELTLHHLQPGLHTRDHCRSAVHFHPSPRARCFLRRRRRSPRALPRGCLACATRRGGGVGGRSAKRFPPRATFNRRRAEAESDAPDAHRIAACTEPEPARHG